MQCPVDVPQTRIFPQFHDDMDDTASVCTIDSGYAS